jgi:hypothetical protein
VAVGMKILKIEARNSGSGCLPAKTSCSPFSLFQSLSARQAKWHQSKEQWFSLITLLAGLLVFIAPAHGSEPSVLTKPSSQTKLVLSAEDLKFGAEQLERLLHDRPELNKMIIKGDSIWNWAVGQFAGVATGERIFWDESDLYSKSFECFGDNLYATPGKPGRIRLRKTDSDGKPMAADKLAYGLIYECSNIGSGPDYKRVDQSALRGELTKEQYIEDELRIEFRAYSKTKDVYQKILLPLTKIRLYPLDPSIWDFSGPKTCDSWVAQLLDQPGYPRDYYGDYYQYTLQPKSNFRRARDLTY